MSIEVHQVPEVGGGTTWVAWQGDICCSGETQEQAVANLKELLQPINAVEVKQGTPVTVTSIKQRRELIRQAVWDHDDEEVAMSEEHQLWRDVLRFIASGQCDNPQEYAHQAVKTANWSFRRG